MANTPSFSAIQFIHHILSVLSASTTIAVWIESFLAPCKPLLLSEDILKKSDSASNEGPLSLIGIFSSFANAIADFCEQNILIGEGDEHW